MNLYVYKFRVGNSSMVKTMSLSLNIPLLACTSLDRKSSCEISSVHVSMSKAHWTFQKVSCEIESPSNFREIILMKSQQQGCLNKFWTMMRPINMLPFFKDQFIYVYLSIWILCLYVNPCTLERPGEDFRSSITNDVSWYLDAWNWTWILGKSRQCSLLLTHFFSLQVAFLC